MLKAVKPQPKDEPQADEFDAARTRYNDARNRLSEIEAQISKIEVARWSALSEDEDRLDQAAQAFLDGKSEPIALAERRLDELRSERTILRRAVDISRRKFHEARERRNRSKVAELRPAHRAAAARVAECVVALAEANAEEARIRARAPGLGFPFLSYPNINLDRPDSQARFFLDYLARVYNVEPQPKLKAAE